MNVHQCPKCVLRFERKTELDYHCREDHPEFRHEYPVRHPVTGNRARTSGAEGARSGTSDWPSPAG